MRFMEMDISMQRKWTWGTCLALTVSLTLACLPGCGNGGSAGGIVVPKEMDPDLVGKRAIEQYDSNGDGKLDAKELEKCPALKVAARAIDADRDGSQSAEEIAARIRQYQKQSDLLSVTVSLIQGRAPLANAQVVFEPEGFLGENIQSYKGVSDASGNVLLEGENISIPCSLPIGLYRVRITGPVEAELGCEVAEDGPSVNRIVLIL